MIVGTFGDLRNWILLTNCLGPPPPLSTTPKELNVDRRCYRFSQSFATRVTVISDLIQRLWISTVSIWLPLVSSALAPLLIDYIVYLEKKLLTNARDMNNEGEVELKV